MICILRLKKDNNGFCDLLLLFWQMQVFFDHDEGLGNTKDFKLFFNSGEACCRVVHLLQFTLLKGSFRNFFNKFNWHIYV